jgi:nucleotide-binding universal stress UspA family protein
MFRRFLVPTDGSDQLSAAMPLVRHLASRTGASVVLICVESPIVNMGNVVDNRSALVGHADKVHQMERCIEELQQDGIDASYDVEFGRPEHGIEAAARHFDSDLIVMTPHQREGFDAVLHPSITARMFASAPAPLLIMPERSTNAIRSGLLAEPESIVVVPLDGSELAERALPFAIALADAYQRGLQLVQVVAPPPDASAYSDAYEHPQSRYQRHVREARHYISALQTDMKRATGLPVDVEVTVGEPAAEIVDIAAEYPTNLIVMGTHGHGTVGRVLLGSVATDVMRRSSVPVLIVPPHAHAPATAPASAATTISSGT